MAFPLDSEAGLILALQDVAAGQAPWEGLLARISAATGAHFAAMLSRSAPLSSRLITAGANGRGGAIDSRPVMAMLGERMRPERLYAAEELADLVDDGEAVVADALEQLAASACIAVRIIAAEVPSTIFGLFGSAPFRAADGAILRRLVPYLKPAIRSAARIERERARAAASTAIAGRSTRAWFLLGREGRVVEWWIGERGPGQGIGLVDDPRGPRLVVDDRRAADALAAIAARQAKGEPFRDRTVPIRGEPSRHLRISMAASDAGPDEPLIMITAHDRLQVPPDCATMLVDLFGLLPSEARLAAALARGDRLAEAATRLGLTIETARNYAKKVFAKTATHGQADLVRLILSTTLAG